MVSVLVVRMKLTNHQIEILVQKVIDSYKKYNVATFKVDEKKVFQRAVEVIKEQFELERQVETEAKALVEQLERQNKGEFEPHKMFLMVKKKLAKDKGLIL